VAVSVPCLQGAAATVVVVSAGVAVALDR
jgi:hypothetical protein